MIGEAALGCQKLGPEVRGGESGVLTCTFSSRSQAVISKCSLCCFFPSFCQAKGSMSLQVLLCKSRTERISCESESPLGLLEHCMEQCMLESQVKDTGERLKNLDDVCLGHNLSHILPRLKLFFIFTEVS